MKESLVACGPGGRAPAGKDSISAAQWPILMAVVKKVVVDNKGPTIKELAESRGTSSSAVSQLVNGLVENGYLVRDTDSQDRRAMVIGLSKKLRRRLSRTQDALVACYEPVFAELSSEELAEYDRLNQKLAAALQKQNQQQRATGDIRP